MGTIKRILGGLFLLGVFLNSNAQTNLTASNKATATLAASCTISAQNIGFGQLILPLTAQSASSSMSVLCNKNASYTIGLAYGSSYPAGTSNTLWHSGLGGYYYSGTPNTPGFNSSGVGQFTQNLPTGYNYIGDTSCPGYVATMGYQCSTYVQQSGGPTSPNGNMLGAVHGDYIGYSIAVPGSPSTVWNTTNTYSDVGTGATKTLSVQATITPGASTSQYPSPDSYSNTVTATVNF